MKWSELSVLECVMEIQRSEGFLYLKETYGERLLVIQIGLYEARAIMQTLEEKFELPFTHLLIPIIFKKMNAKCTELLISEEANGIFYSQLMINGKPVEARPSDGVAVALLSDAPIFCSENVLQKCGFTAKDIHDRSRMPEHRLPEHIEKYIIKNETRSRIKRLRFLLQHAINEERYEEAQQIKKALDILMHKSSR